MSVIHSVTTDFDQKHYKSPTNTKDFLPYLPENGVELDLSNNILKVSIVTRTPTNSYIDIVTLETVTFPLLRYITCEKCGQPVNVYAKGDIRHELGKDGIAFRTEYTGVPEFEIIKNIFSEAWERKKSWQLITARGAFGLIAKNGHNFKLKNSGNGHTLQEPTCYATKRNPAVIIPETTLIYERTA